MKDLPNSIIDLFTNFFKLPQMKEKTMKQIGVELIKSYQSVFIIIDELHLLLYPDFEEYKNNISNNENDSKNLLQRAFVLWKLFLQLIKVPGVFLYSTTKNIIFNFLGNEKLLIKNEIELYKRDVSPSYFYEVKLNPFEIEHIDLIIENTEGFLNIRNWKEKNLKDYKIFIVNLILLTKGVPFIVHHVLNEFERYQNQDQFDNFLRVYMISILEKFIPTIFPSFIENINDSNYLEMILNAFAFSLYSMKFLDTQEYDTNIKINGIKEKIGKITYLQLFTLSGIYIKYENHYIEGIVPEYCYLLLLQSKTSFLLPDISSVSSKDISSGDLFENIIFTSLITRLKYSILSFNQTFSFLKDTNFDDRIKYNGILDLPKAMDDCKSKVQNEIPKNNFF